MEEVKDDGIRVWLLAWNKDKWFWEYYQDKCIKTQNGQTVMVSWSCANTNPKIGDEVFLIKIGGKPRCLIGHGHVVRGSYDREHFDTVKSSEGKTIHYIDVEFDRLLDYEKETCVSQDELKAKCSAQNWSPQSSGIEIKPGVLPTLHALWDDVTRDKGQNWWPSLTEYDPGISAEQYHDLFLNESIVKRTWLQALYEMYQMPNHLGTCKQMGDKYGYDPAHYISYMSTIAGKIAKETKCTLLPRKEKNSRYWPVLFQGKYTKDKTQGTYCWKMRAPVIEAMERLIDEGIFEAAGTFKIEEKTQAAHFPHNTIFYGPPGTGKTYNSVIYAVAICDGKSLDDMKNEPYRDVLQRYNELKDAGRIAFTTFHQSYGYEEFIEGIKPKLGTDSEKLEYTIEDGAFKAFCNRAGGEVKVQSLTSTQMKEEPRIWGMLLGGTGMTALKKQCFENNEIRLGWSEVDDDDVDGDFVADDKISWNAKHMVSDFKNSMEVGDLVVIEKSSKSIDAIGVITGEYLYDKSQGRYPRSRAVEWLVKDIDQDILQFLPNDRKRLSRFSVFAFDYIGMDVISEILNKYLDEPVMDVEHETKPYVFIIDEINRGNISKIFGELITLIEGTKRAGASEAMEVTLPYSKELFSIPQNVYIIGTMNTADRSIALIDTALRRRFDFIEMMPDSKVLENSNIL